MNYHFESPYELGQKIEFTDSHGTQQGTVRGFQVTENGMALLVVAPFKGSGSLRVAVVQGEQVRGQVHVGDGLRT